MSLPHPASGETIDLRPLGPDLAEAASIALVRTDDIEVMRLVLPKGRSVPEHHVPGEITLHCLEGTIQVQAQGRLQVLHAQQMLYLHGNEPYALVALENSSVLMTMLRKDSDTARGPTH